MMKRDLRFSRRELLKGIGAGAALFPLLESDPARRAVPGRLGSSASTSLRGRTGCSAA